ncbi:MAG: hypothetical protein JSU07_08090 [Bacteroidetes bacterium]|nr:hypothetical protein [Bacteroidota bacterium]
MKIGLRFFVSWIGSSILMFSLFYLWHGVFLNDFQRIMFPLTWFIVFAAFTYLILGAVIYFLFESQFLKPIRGDFSRGLLTGIISGFCLFMIVTVLNFSLTKNLKPEHLIIDCIWQMIEQTSGALLILLFKQLIYDHDFEKEHAD